MFLERSSKDMLNIYTYFNNVPDDKLADGLVLWHALNRTNPSFENRGWNMDGPDGYMAHVVHQRKRKPWSSWCSGRTWHDLCHACSAHGSDASMSSLRHKNPLKRAFDSSLAPFYIWSILLITADILKLHMNGRLLNRWGSALTRSRHCPINLPSLKRILHQDHGKL